MFVATGFFHLSGNAHRLGEAIQPLPVAVGGKGTDMRVQQGGYGVIVETLAQLAVAVLGVWGDGGSFTGQSGGGSHMHLL